MKRQIEFVRGAAAALTLVAIAAHAQPYPSRVIRVIEPAADACCTLLVMAPRKVPAPRP